MFRSYLKSAIRSLLRYRSFSLINLIGLTLGIGAATLIFLVADYEARFDRFHSQPENIFRVVSGSPEEQKAGTGGVIPYPFGEYLRAKRPNLIVTQLHYSGDAVIKVGHREPVNQTDVTFADEHFFRVLDFAAVDSFWLRGNRTTALKAPGKVVLTQSTARKFFGTSDPMGQTLRIDNRADLEVTGIIRDLPPTSHLPVQMVVSYATLNKDFLAGLDPKQWDYRNSGFTYVRLPHASADSGIENAFREIAAEHGINALGRQEKFYLQPLMDIHFNPDFEHSTPTEPISRDYMRLLWLLAGVIIVVACINYVNLASSLAVSKSKDVGIRKAIGASRSQLVAQYLMETGLVTVLAAILGVGGAWLLIPTVGQELHKSLFVGQILDARFISGLIAGVLMISLLAGGYPAVLLAGFNPVKSLKKQFFTPGRMAVGIRQGLVVLQFATAIGLLVCTLVIARQVDYGTHKSLGFRQKAVVEVALPENDATKQARLRTLLREQVAVRRVSYCLGAPLTNNNFNTHLRSADLSEALPLHVLLGDSAYLKTYDIRLIAGRAILPSEESGPQAVIVNETLVRQLNLTPAAALGKRVKIGINDTTVSIVGVMRDFHIGSVHEVIPACALTTFPFFYYSAAVQLDPDQLRSGLASVESAFKTVYPDYTFRYEFVDDNLARHYRQETTAFYIFRAFSVVATFLCCIGLWGLITFVVAHKTKEIGIRKVLGASIGSLVALLTRDFVRLILIAFLVASPVAWYWLHGWLEHFAYRVPLSWWLFAAAGGLAILIALLTVGYQTLRAATANPVKSLRTE